MNCQEISNLPKVSKLFFINDNKLGRAFDSANCDEDRDTPPDCDSPSPDPSSTCTCEDYE